MYRLSTSSASTKWGMSIWQHSMTATYLKLSFTIYFILFFLMMIIVTSTSSISQFLHIRNIGYHTIYSPRYNLSHLMLSPPLLYCIFIRPYLMSTNLLLFKIKKTNYNNHSIRKTAGELIQYSINWYTVLISSVFIHR